MNTNSQPRVAFGLYAERPLPTADGGQAGDIFITTDAGLAGRIFIVRLDSTDARQWVEIKALDSPTTLTLFVATTGNDANDGLTPATALLTLDMALRLIAENCPTQRWMISMGAGVFPVSPAVTNAFESNGYAIPYTGGGQGLTVECPAIVGTMVDSGFGNRTMSVFASGTSPTFTTMTDSLGGFTVSAFKGWWVRFTSGTNLGKIFQIQDNTANVLTLILSGSTGFVNNDQYVIEDAGTILRKTIPGGSPAQTDQWIGGPCIFDALVFDYVQNAVSQTVNFNLAGGSMGRCRFKNTGTATGALAVAFNGGPWGLGAIDRYRSTAVYAPKQNVIGGLDFVGNTSAASLTVNTSTGTARGSGRFESTSISVIGNIAFTNVYMNLGSIVAGGEGARALFVTMRMDASPGTALNIDGVVWRAQVLCALGGFVQLNSVDMSNGTGAGNVVVCVGGIVQSAQIASGAGNVGVPWACARRGLVLLSSPGVNETVAGAVAGNDVTVGANAVTTYANIAGGLTAFVSDVGAAATQLCLVM